MVGPYVGSATTSDGSLHSTEAPNRVTNPTLTNEHIPFFVRLADGNTHIYANDEIELVTWYSPQCNDTTHIILSLVR